MRQMSHETHHSKYKCSGVVIFINVSKKMIRNCLNELYFGTLICQRPKKEAVSITEKNSTRSMANFCLGK